MTFIMHLEMESSMHEVIQELSLMLEAFLMETSIRFIDCPTSAHPSPPDD